MKILILTLSTAVFFTSALALASTKSIELSQDINQLQSLIFPKAKTFLDIAMQNSNSKFLREQDEKNGTEIYEEKRKVALGEMKAELIVVGTKLAKELKNGQLDATAPIAAKLLATANKTNEVVELVNEQIDVADETLKILFEYKMTIDSKLKALEKLNKYKASEQAQYSKIRDEIIKELKLAFGILKTVMPQTQELTDAYMIADFYRDLISADFSNKMLFEDMQEVSEALGPIFDSISTHRKNEIAELDIARDDYGHFRYFIDSRHDSSLLQVESSDDEGFMWRYFEPYKLRLKRITKQLNSYFKSFSSNSEEIDRESLIPINAEPIEFSYVIMTAF